MDTAKYLEPKICGGQVVNMVIEDLHKLKNFKSMLFVRTPTTGAWMDPMILTYKHLNPCTVLYTRNSNTTYGNGKRLYTMLDHCDLEFYFKNLNRRFDLICMDPFHEYSESISDFTLFTSMLSDDGILISHDCFPHKKQYSGPIFKPGHWSGITYVAFVETAYNNPSWFYAIIDNDTGIGIISKNAIENLKNNFDREKQECLIQMNKDGDDGIYEYFCENSKELINLIRE
jgi:hypothetical protein